MKIAYSKDFIKQFKNLRKNERVRVSRAIALFVEQPNAPQLRNHQLKGRLAQYHSISAGGDIRIHYKVYQSKMLILFVEVDSHSWLY
ncbi:MAG: type II toxin-antitoxin system mRNA interferase toxin, RelE/StbE family [Coriobacteriales bacterium]|jgi:addiction module RelE/StbE family toxin|nr:type II toxin-antitoxin system mRNA interferase toxin, RelE/StbE family [Coriobacteriales bacterium]